MAGKARSEPDLGTRERIKAVAAELYVLRGHDGFSFGDVAEAIGTTRANIHHHFGNKRRLMAELIEEFVAGAEARIARHWAEGEVPLPDRFRRQLDDLRGYYERFNPEPGSRNVWSPVARLRLDLAILGDLSVGALERVDRAYDRTLRSAIARAVASGELGKAAPVDDIARLLRVVLLSCAPITQDTGSFAEVERLFASLERTIIAAWSPPPEAR
jgi:AcrR family transcriptional regulator